jgi:hypothetical protein
MRSKSRNIIMTLPNVEQELRRWDVTREKEQDGREGSKNPQKLIRFVWVLSLMNLM